MSETNGTPRTLEQVRDLARLERAELRLAEARAQKRLLESWCAPSAWGDPWDRWADAGRGCGGGGGTILWDRTNGPNPLLTDESWLRETRDRARYLATTNPLAINVLETLVDFVVGDGVTFRTTSKDRANEELVAQVQDVIDDHLEDNCWGELAPELLVRSRRDGEYFLRWFDQGGELSCRIVEPEQVRNPPKATPEDGWRNGIRFDKDDAAVVIEYAIWYDGAEEPDFVPEDQIDHVKVNVDRFLPRGLSDFLPTAAILEETLKLLVNMRTGEGVRAALVGFWEYETATSATVGAAVAAARDAQQPRGGQADPVTGKTPNMQRIEPGTISHVPKGRKFIAPPASPNAAAQTAIVQASLRSAGARWGMPEYMISADSSNANFASTLVSGSPFVRRVRRWQTFYERCWKQSVWRAVEHAVAAGRLPAEALEVVELQVESPDPHLADELQQAQVDQIDMQSGVLSRQTRRQRRGLDDEQERVNLKEEPVTPPAPPPGQGQGPPGGGFFPGLGESVDDRLESLRARYGNLSEVVAGAAALLVESNTHHKGKGPGGGQFTGGAGGGGSKLSSEHHHILGHLANGAKSVAFLHHLQPGVKSAHGMYHATVMPANDLEKRGLIRQKGTVQGPVSGVGAGYAGPGSAPADKVEQGDESRRIYELTDEGRAALGLPPAETEEEDTYDPKEDYRSRRNFAVTMIAKHKSDIEAAEGKPRLTKELQAKLKAQEDALKKLENHPGRQP